MTRSERSAERYVLALRSLSPHAVITCATSASCILVHNVTIDIRTHRTAWTKGETHGSIASGFPRGTDRSSRSYPISSGRGEALSRGDRLPGPSADLRSRQRGLGEPHEV